MERDRPGLELAFSAPVWFWHGPAPFHFVTVPQDLVGMLSSAAELVTYGWGMVPASVEVGATTWTTSLWPKDGGYIVPIKAAVRRAEGIEVGDPVAVRLRVAV